MDTSTGLDWIFKFVARRPTPGSSFRIEVCLVRLKVWIITACAGVKKETTFDVIFRYWTRFADRFNREELVIIVEDNLERVA
ncbi:unnamed protein product [Leptosia nina]|uniref:Transposase n=1 Tax=Leptosia nina TaxID=320188 RepID=A0AAV1J2S0_9NEOP